MAHQLTTGSCERDPSASNAVLGFKREPQRPPVLKTMAVELGSLAAEEQGETEEPDVTTRRSRGRDPALSR